MIDYVEDSESAKSKNKQAKRRPANPPESFVCKKQKTPNGIDDDSEDAPLPMPIVAVFMVDLVYFCALMFLLRLLCLLPIK